MSDPAPCNTCSGNGWIPVQVCCGNSAVGAEYMGAQELICCGEPNEDSETCPTCKGSGEAPRSAPRVQHLPNAL